ncbi:Endochitinase [Diplonema papillatum]|nr:Endochitinase [Diplonema papillatum]KAJ9449155.1 Endochitinase [Diplonema papillatum]KAJ9449476.1 Endochitinase [Diplonema papillatum]
MRSVVAFCCVAFAHTVAAQSCYYQGSRGSCINVNSQGCRGTVRTGLCPGPSNIRCCDPVGATCSSGSSRGSCINVNRAGCSGTLRSGLCPGPSNVRCCLRSAAPTPAPATGGCTTRINSYRGTCKSVSSCGGGTFNGLCPGSSSIKCCVNDPTSAPWATRYVTLSQFRSSFESLSTVRASALLPYFNSALSTLLSGAPSSQVRCNRIAAFVAQVGHESVGLRYFEELASGAAYEGRTNLGNTQPGDGRRFKGRGPIQLTGRYNYAAAGSALGLPLTSKPESVSFPSVGFKTTVWFWMSNNLNQYADSGSASHFVTLTRRINGGTNGLTDRRNRWAAAKTVFGC